jgi:hypothetical protein
VMEEPERLVGENAATVGGFGSYVGCGVDGPFSGMYVALEDMEASHGVSGQLSIVSLGYEDNKRRTTQGRVLTDSRHAKMQAVVMR